MATPAGTDDADLAPVKTALESATGEETAVLAADLHDEAHGLAMVLHAWLAAPAEPPAQRCADLPDVLDFPRALLAALSTRRA